MQAELATYKAIAEPAKAKFFEAGHFSAAVDQVIIELLCCGVARNKLPQLFVVFARFYGILIPGRKKKVPGPSRGSTAGARRSSASSTTSRASRTSRRWRR